MPSLVDVAEISVHKRHLIECGRVRVCVQLCTAITVLLLGTEPKGEMTPEEQAEAEKEQKFRHRSKGNIRFIGELFKRSMLSERIMHKSGPPALHVACSLGLCWCNGAKGQHCVRKIVC